MTMMQKNNEKQDMNLPGKHLVLSMSNIRKAWLLIRGEGISRFICEFKKYISRRDRSISYSKWVKENEKSGNGLEAERKFQFIEKPMISIVVPVYNTKMNHFNEMVDSVIGQTYENWELILVNGGSTDNLLTTRMRELSSGFPKIRLIDLTQNLGISGNTNQGINGAVGEYIGLLDHDDILDRSALYEVVKVINAKNPDLIYSDEDKFTTDLTKRFSPHFKTDFNFELLHAYNYICHFAVIRTSLVKQLEGERSSCDGAQDYDLFLRIADHTKNIHHIPKILYHWRVHELSTSSSLETKSYVIEATFKALSDHLDRIGREGSVNHGLIPGVYHVRYNVKNAGKVSIIIPNRNSCEILKRCIESILNKSTYPDYEILVIENNSNEPDIFDYYETISRMPKVRVLQYQGEFNYSAINNWACNQANGVFYLLLNNDVEVINPDWIERMVEYAQFPENGAVGAKLYYPDGRIQHGGVILGIGGIAGHAHKYMERNSAGYMARLMVVQNLSAVTAACMMVRAEVYNQAGGLDEGYSIAFNDVDFCMKLTKAGYKIVWTPYTELYHYESLSRGSENTVQKVKRFNREIERFKLKWGYDLDDPHYNINLTREREDFSIAKR